MGLASKLDCPCGSGKPYADCCEPYLTALKIETFDKGYPFGTLITDWTDKYSPPIVKSFRKKAWPLVFRISIYLDVVFQSFYPLGYKKVGYNQKEADTSIMAIKHNILCSIFASFSSLSQGLFLQSGALTRCCMEDSFVLLDLFENKKQYEKFMGGRYSTNNLISRIRAFLPEGIIDWYGHFSANFAHFGPLHSAPYVPRACYPDNYIIWVRA